MSTPRRCRLFAVDLDGTLLDRQGHPHASDVEALRALAAQGVLVSIATGRLYGGVARAVEAVGFDGPLACADGSHIVDARTHGDLLHHPFAPDAFGRVRQAFARHDVAAFFFERDLVVHDTQGIPFLDYARVWSERCRQHPTSLHAAASWDAEVTGVIGVGPEPHVKALLAELHADPEHVQAWAFPVGRPFLRDGATWGLIARAAGPSKGTAIAWLARHHGLDLDEVIVVGDWHNDVPMFQVAGRSFAMNQAPDDVKASATDVLDASSSTGGGIAEAARRAGLLPWRR